MYLYDMEVIDEEVFLKWKEEVTDEYPGKGKALFQVRFLLSLSLLSDIWPLAVAVRINNVSHEPARFILLSVHYTDQTQLVRAQASFAEVQIPTEF